jgi:hypothetical protein
VEEGTLMVEEAVGHLGEAAHLELEGVEEPKSLEVVGEVSWNRHCCSRPSFPAVCFQKALSNYREPPVFDVARDLCSDVALLFLYVVELCCKAEIGSRKARNDD